MAIEQLRRFTPPSSSDQPLTLQGLVPGDIALLLEGNRVSADERLITTDGLLVDTSTLTGESVPVARTSSSLGHATWAAGIPTRKERSWATVHNQ